MRAQRPQANPNPNPNRNPTGGEKLPERLRPMPIAARLCLCCVYDIYRSISIVHNRNMCIHTGKILQ